MATGGPSTSPTGGRHHFVDIHPVLHDDASGGCGNLGKQQTSNPVKYRGGSGEGERNAVLHRPFSRQVSLETGVSVLSMQKEQKGGGGKKEGPSGLLRSGKSLGVIRDSRSGCDPTSRKGDFSIFRTKSTLNKQNSLLPSRRENDVDFQNMEGVSANRQEEDAINKSVPAGRYFAALQGPELDQVRVRTKIISWNTSHICKRIKNIFFFVLHAGF